MSSIMQPPAAPAKKKVLPARPKIMKPRTAKDVPDPTRYESPTQPANVANSVHGGPYNPGPYGPPTPAPPKPAPTPAPAPAPQPAPALPSSPTPPPRDAIIDFGGGSPHLRRRRHTCILRQQDQAQRPTPPIGFSPHPTDAEYDRRKYSGHHGLASLTPVGDQ